MFILHPPQLPQSTLQLAISNTLTYYASNVWCDTVTYAHHSTEQEPVYFIQWHVNLLNVITLTPNLVANLPYMILTTIIIQGIITLFVKNTRAK